jgi:signal transduction histidine kinase
MASRPSSTAPSIWEDGSVALDRGEGRSVLVFFRWLDEAFLAQLEEDFLLPDLQLSRGEQTAGRAYTDLTAYSGETLGTLHWTAEQPGYAMLHALVLPGTIAALLTLLLLGLVVRRAGRALRELETNHAKLQSQAAELTAARDKAEQQIQVETELRHNADAASRAKSEFLALISHELRTPLNAILGFSETIARQTFGRNAFDRYREYAQHIHDSGTHLLSIINDILDLSKIEARRFELNEEDILLGKVLERCVTLVRERASEKNLELVCEENELWVRVDERALKQILINLLTNAIKFTGAGGRVAVTTQASEAGLEIAISDTGIGMSEEGLARAMLPFGQADSALTRSVEGTGLGLNVTQALTQLHGGYLTIDSTPGVGTTASVHLPAFRVLSAHTKAAS